MLVAWFRAGANIDNLGTPSLCGLGNITPGVRL
jgi:hypothetical protein